METPSQVRLDKIYHPIPMRANAAKGNETQVGSRKVLRGGLWPEVQIQSQRRKHSVAETK